MVLTRVPRLGTGFIQEPCLRVPNGPLMCSATGCNGQTSPDTMLLLLVWRGTAQKKAEDYGHDNLGENLSCFDFSIIDYSVMAGGQASRLDYVVCRCLMNHNQVFENMCLPRCLHTNGKHCCKWRQLAHCPPYLFMMMPQIT